MQQVVSLVGHVENVNFNPHGCIFSGSHAPAWESIPALGVVVLLSAFPRGSVGTRMCGSVVTRVRGSVSGSHALRGNPYRLWVWSCLRLHSHAGAWERGCAGAWERGCAGARERGSAGAWERGFRRYAMVTVNPPVRVASVVMPLSWINWSSALPAAVPA